MKYVMIRNARGNEFPVFCLAPQTHADLAAAWRRDDRSQVVGAGFVEFVMGYTDPENPALTPDGKPATSVMFARTFGHSESLQLSPRPQDAGIITAFYLGTVAMNKIAQTILREAGVTCAK
jgi:hypothetical protein